MARCFKPRLYLFGLLFLFSTAASIDDFYDDTVERRREWTEWFNTDSPNTGTGDDESLASIRKRGFSICKGATPVDAVCRMAADQTIVFNVGTTEYTDDVLVIPCTSIGIVCRNTDQGENGTCKDYGIRFQCLTVSVRDEQQMGNLGLIGIAAGLSVIVPILCVTCMHVTRMLKERRRCHLDDGSSSTDEETYEHDSQSVGDLPPSYSALFGEAAGSTEQLLSEASRFVSGETGDRNTVRNLNVGHPSGANEATNHGAIYSIPNSPRLSRSVSIDSATTQIDILPLPCRRNRIPGMHLSIIDLILSNEESNSYQENNDQSYIQTPPPSYQEVIINLGGVPYKTGEQQSAKSIKISEPDTDTVVVL